MQIVSLKMAEPQTNVLGINKNAMANCLIRCGYQLANVRNMTQMPVYEKKAKRSAIGKYVVKLSSPNIEANTFTICDEGS